MWILDPTAADIQALNDQQLVGLVESLCHMEAKALGLSRTAVTRGGKDSEADGGIDVRVSGQLAAAHELVSIPTGIQVKARAMPEGRIIDEMRPQGRLRASIQALLETGGVYMIASGKEDLTDRRRERLLGTMQAQVPEKFRDRVNILDSRQLAAWSAKHPGVAAWIRQQAGRPLDGWEPWGSWSASDQPADLPYLIDEEARVSRPLVEPETLYSIKTGIALVREALRGARSVARVTGLSGMGKTRFAQALFDDRVGESALTLSSAIYADAGHELAVSPGRLARALVNEEVEAILIVDNCPAARHRELVDIVRRPDSRLRLLSIDFDVGDDQPDHTEVFRLQNAGEDLIASLLRQRAPALTHADRYRIVEFAGGNTRIALAIALAPGGGKGIAHLRNEALLDRLFLKDRREPDVELRRVARVASLVYAFSVSGEEAVEARVLADLADVSEVIFHEKVADLLERGLAQKRGDQRAILPPAIAAWLAAEALAKLPEDRLWKAFADTFPSRLQVSFARRLGQLQGTSQAVPIAKRMMLPVGRFGTPSDENGLEMRAVRYLAPVAPEEALTVAVRTIASGRRLEPWHPMRRELRELLIRLAYEPAQFDAAVDLMADLACAETDKQGPYETYRDTILPLFHVQRSGTHATPEQRFTAIDRWLASNDERRRALGFAALGTTLETRFAGAVPHLDYGVERRDSGWHPRTYDALRDWFAESLGRARRLLEDDETRTAAKALIAKHYPSLVSVTVAVPNAVHAMRAAADGAFWSKGWFAACDAVWRLRKRRRPRLVTTLEREMRPATLADEVEVWMRLDWHDWRNPEHADQARDDWPEARRRALKVGRLAASDEALLTKVLADPNYRGSTLGEGMAEASPNDFGQGWGLLSRLAAGIKVKEPNWSVFTGYLRGVRNRSPSMADQLLDAAAIDPAIKHIALSLCVFQDPIDDAALERILMLLRDPDISGEGRRAIDALRLDDSVSPDRVAELIDVLVARDEVDSALTLLWLRQKNAEWSPALRKAAAEALTRAELARDHRGQGDWDRRMASVAEKALIGPEGASFAERVLARISALGDDPDRTWRRDLPERLTKVLFTLQPRVALDAFLPWLTDDRRYALRSLIQEHDDDDQPARGVLNRVPLAMLQGWIAEDHGTRALLVAAHCSYFERGPEGKAFQWSPLARMLIDFGDPDVLEEIASRFDTGASSGGWAQRYARRRPMVEELQIHSSEAVRVWADRLLQYIDKQIERLAEWDRRPPDRFE